MNKLKVYFAELHSMRSEEGLPRPIISDESVYKSREADVVLAEKDAEIAKLKAGLSDARDSFDVILQAATQYTETDCVIASTAIKKIEAILNEGEK